MFSLISVKCFLVVALVCIYVASVQAVRRKNSKYPQGTPYDLLSPFITWNTEDDDTPDSATKEPATTTPHSDPADTPIDHRNSPMGREHTPNLAEDKRLRRLIADKGLPNGDWFAPGHVVLNVVGSVVQAYNHVFGHLDAWMSATKTRPSRRENEVGIDPSRNPLFTVVDGSVTIRILP